MLPVVGAVPEPFPTEPTNKGSLPRVGPVVVLQVSPTVERLGQSTQENFLTSLVRGRKSPVKLNTESKAVEIR